MHRVRLVSLVCCVAQRCPFLASIGENVVIGRDVVIGQNVTLYPGCIIGDGVSIGDDSLLYPNVVVYHHCVIGRRALIQAGAVTVAMVSVLPKRGNAGSTSRKLVALSLVTTLK